MSNKNITKNLVNTHSESIDWSVIQKDMKTKLGNDIYESWLRKIDFVEEMNNYVLLSVSTRFTTSLSRLCSSIHWPPDLRR